MFLHLAFFKFKKIVMEINFELMNIINNPLFNFNNLGLDNPLEISTPDSYLLNKNIEGSPFRDITEFIKNGYLIVKSNKNHLYTFEKGYKVNVDIDKLYATQSTITITTLENKLNGIWPLSEIMVFENLPYLGYYLIIDGHHTACSYIKQGKTKIQCSIIKYLKRK
jgi:hypothetical protein